jgi:very-short-patch-repair endonuclease
MQSYNPILIPRARAMRRAMPEPEFRMWAGCLQKMDVRFRRQRPIGRFIVDFYCAALKLVIEIDGGSHDSEAAVAYDHERSLYLQGLGLTVMRFTNDEVMENLEGVHQSLAAWVVAKQNA